MRRFLVFCGLLTTLLAAGCVSLKAPERIVINGSDVRRSDDDKRQERDHDDDHDDDDDYDDDDDDDDDD